MCLEHEPPVSEPCEDQDCFDLIPEGYRKYVTPRTPNGERLNVTFSLSIFDMDEINTEKMDFRLHGYVHSVWSDMRLIMNGSEVNNGKCAKHIWTPEVVFEAVKSADLFGSSYLHISLDKIVNMAQRFDS
ncbi:hypothetical protein NPIL_655401 [Nephila pilipes]|uniref:Neurotransmitter-gated ion-channel ligand-binding domain-containing protein n=1 Tax=Nephila pilipes TaxID=299642 RepID=A0A8X6JGS3_NEPPI|nr:hypothetical protein NPIL_655401 [Nephila pilipes]